MTFITLRRWFMLALGLITAILSGCAVTYTPAPVGGVTTVPSLSDWRQVGLASWATVRDGWTYRAEYRLGELELSKSRPCGNDRRRRQREPDVIEYRNWKPGDPNAIGGDCAEISVLVPTIIAEGPAFWSGLPTEVRVLYADTAKQRQNRQRPPPRPGERRSDVGPAPDQPA